MKDTLVLARAMLSLVSMGLLIVVKPAAAQEWTRFRGPNGTGISNAKTIPTEWTANAFRWKTPLPGMGHSSPVAWGEKIFVTSADDQARQFHVLCVAAENGQILWRRDFKFSPFPKHNYNSFASGSPCVDANAVYVCRAMPDGYVVTALDHSGKVVWERDLGPYRCQHGGGHSPILHEGKLIVSNEQDGDSSIVAMNASTGEVQWKTPRRTTEAAYSTPCVYREGGVRPVLVFTSESHGVCALDPESGKQLWEFRAFDKRVVSSPVIAGEVIVGSTGSGGGGNYVAAVLPPKKDGDASLAFSIRKSAPYVPTSIYHGGLLFLWSDGGIASCVEADTGEVLWQERVTGNYFSSPIWVGSRLFGISTRGEVVVLNAGREFKILARNPLNEMTHSTPAVSNERMYIHTSRHLVSIGAPN